MCGVGSIAVCLLILFVTQVDDDGHIFGVAGCFLLGDGPQMARTARV